MPISGHRKLSKQIKPKGGQLKHVKENLVDMVWGSDRPSRPLNPVRILDVAFSGMGFEEKIGLLRKDLEKKQSSGIVLTLLDEIAWLFNLRGSDIEYNPVFFAYATVTGNDVSLFIDRELDDSVKTHLGDKVSIKSYNAIHEELERLKKLAESSGTASSRKKILVSTNVSCMVFEELGGEDNVDEVQTPVCHAKSIKNDVELEGMRACHIRDGAALSEFFAWLEDQLTRQAKIDEVEAADTLEKFRSKQEHFVGLSFDTISSTGPNAAIIHYKPIKGDCSIIDPNAIYLCDSGGQYLDGTTDTTRTWHFGEPTEMEKYAFTLVLKGNLALERVRFPKGTTGYQLDIIARQYLWQQGLNYRHGTGHGVGSYLNVHEGPMGIGSRSAYGDVSIKKGNVISNEPGYYEDGKFGIRIENVIMVKEVPTKFQFDDKPFLGFENVTMTPICTKLIDKSMMTDEEVDMLNRYHEEVWEKTKGFFEKCSLAHKWLRRHTLPI